MTCVPEELDDGVGVHLLDELLVVLEEHVVDLVPVLAVGGACHLDLVHQEFQVVLLLYHLVPQLQLVLAQFPRVLKVSLKVDQFFEVFDDFFLLGLAE